MNNARTCTHQASIIASPFAIALATIGRFELLPDLGLNHHLLLPSDSMKSFISIISITGLLVSSQLLSTSAFVAPSNAAKKTSYLRALQNNDGISCNRQTFLKTIASVAVATPLVASADGGFEDLAMPSADEQKAEDVSKLELDTDL